MSTSSAGCNPPAKKPFATVLFFESAWATDSSMIKMGQCRDSPGSDLLKASHSHWQIAVWSETFHWGSRFVRMVHMDIVIHRTPKATPKWSHVLLFSLVHFATAFRITVQVNWCKARLLGATVQTLDGLAYDTSTSKNQQLLHCPKVSETNLRAALTVELNLPMLLLGAS